MRLSQERIKKELSSMDDWLLLSLDGVDALSKQWHFSDFKQAFEFSKQLSDLAEQHNHHPRLMIEWGCVEVIWWSHDEAGVTERDIKLAQACDSLSS